jgi:esterase
LRHGVAAARAPCSIRGVQPTGFVPHHDFVTAGAAPPERWLLVLHGILGSGANWRTFARRLAAACPAWGFVLVDLRAHGQSTAAPPPHSLLAAAEDLVRLEATLDRPVAGVLGHSFGGKVALAFADLRPTRRATADGRRPSEEGEIEGAKPPASSRLDQVWVLDSLPGARACELASVRTAAVIRMLEEMPRLLPTRERFVEIVEEHGHDRTFAAWLAMNLRHAEGGYQLRLDMTAIRALLESYVATDLWPVVERPDKARELHFVVGGRSDVVLPAGRDRLTAIAARAPHVHVHTLPNAGHWLHVDDPDGLFSIVSSGLSGLPASD